MLRIASLVPSATETLFAIGAGHMLVARSHECDHPPEALAAPILTASSPGVPTALSPSGVGHAADSDTLSARIDTAVREHMAQQQPLYTLDEPLLASLAPDLILTQDLCHVCSIDVASVRAVAQRLPRPPGAAPVRVLSLNPQSLEDVLDDLLRLGETIDELLAARGHNHGDAPTYAARALDRVSSLRERLYTAQDHVNFFSQSPVVALLEWTDPLFVAGHWTPQLIERAGGQHPLNPTRPIAHAGAAAGPIGDTQRRAGKALQLPHELLVACNPDVLIIAPCGLPLAPTRRALNALAREPWYAGLKAVRSGRVALVDGNQFFSRPGPRLVDAYEWLVSYLNDRPELCPPNFAWEPAGA